MLVPELDETAYNEIVFLKGEYYKKLMHLTELNSHLVGFMELMHDHQIVLVTTAKKKNAHAVLGHYGLERYFSHIITAEDVQQTKPKPDAYLLALEKNRAITS